METAFVVVVVAILVFLGFAATRPGTYLVERCATVNAPANQIFARIDDFHRWLEWSPWEKLDPNMRKTFGGAEQGSGATYAWEGNNKAGKGQMEIVSCSSPSNVRIKLDFEKPFPSTNLTDFMLEPSGDQTRVTWRMTGPSSYLIKVMGIFINMDTLIGKDFEEGLANLKRVSQAPADNQGAARVG